MSDWISCWQCKFWFLPDNDKKNYKVVQFEGKIIGAICPDCSGYIREKEKEKKIQ